MMWLLCAIWTQICPKLNTSDLLTDVFVELISNARRAMAGASG